MAMFGCRELINIGGDFVAIARWMLPDLNMDMEQPGVFIQHYNTYQRLQLFCLSQERCTITLINIYHTFFSASGILQF